MCNDIFLPRAARLVNTRNLSISVVRQNVSTGNKCLPPCFYTPAQPALLQKTGCSFHSEISQVRTCGLSHKVLSVGHHTPPVKNGPQVSQVYHQRAHVLIRFDKVPHLLRAYVYGDKKNQLLSWTPDAFAPPLKMKTNIKKFYLNDFKIYSHTKFTNEISVQFDYFCWYSPRGKLKGQVSPPKSKIYIFPRTCRLELQSFWRYWQIFCMFS